MTARTSFAVLALAGGALILLAAPATARCKGTANATTNRPKTVMGNSQNNCAGSSLSQYSPVIRDPGGRFA